jgi:hypothetical protein
MQTGKPSTRKSPRRIALLLVFALLGATTQASAETLLEKVFTLLHQTDPAVPDANQVHQVESWISACSSASSDDEVVACAEAAAASDQAQDAGVPVWVPYAINIYFDVEKPDFWGLAEDAGIVVACAVLEASTSVDVCGAVKALIDAANAVGNAVVASAEAVAQFFSDLGDWASDAVCALTGCSSSPPVLDPATYLNSRIPDGLTQRLLGITPWHAFAGPPAPSQDAQVVLDGAAAGVAAAGLRQALNGYRDNVYKQWDLKIVNETVPHLAQAMSKNGYKPVNPTTVNQAADLGKQQAGNDTSIANLIKPGMDVCRGFAHANGGLEIDDWIADGRAYITKSSITNAGNSCKDFDAALTQKFAKEQVNQFSQAFQQDVAQGKCKQQSGSSYADTYKCTTPASLSDCNGFQAAANALKLDHSPQCIRDYYIPGVDGTTPATNKQVYFVCNGHCELHYLGTQPAGCKAPDQLPTPGMPGSKPNGGVSCPANPTSGTSPIMNSPK